MRASMQRIVSPRLVQSLSPASHARSASHGMSTLAPQTTTSIRPNSGNSLSRSNSPIHSQSNSRRTSADHSGAVPAAAQRTQSRFKTVHLAVPLAQSASAPSLAHLQSQSIDTPPQLSNHVGAFESEVSAFRSTTKLQNNVCRHLDLCLTQFMQDADLASARLTLDALRLESCASAAAAAATGVQTLSTPFEALLVRLLALPQHATTIVALYETLSTANVQLSSRAYKAVLHAQCQSQTPIASRLAVLDRMQQQGGLRIEITTLNKLLHSCMTQSNSAQCDAAERQACTEALNDLFTRLPESEFNSHTHCLRILYHLNLSSAGAATGNVSRTQSRLALRAWEKLEMAQQQQQPSVDSSSEYRMTTQLYNTLLAASIKASHFEVVNRIIKSLARETHTSSQADELTLKQLLSLAVEGTDLNEAFDTVAFFKVLRQQLSASNSARQAKMSHLIPSFAF